jgi:hypothetical protein
MFIGNIGIAVNDLLFYQRLDCFSYDTVAAEFRIHAGLGVSFPFRLGESVTIGPWMTIGCAYGGVFYPIIKNGLEFTIKKIVIGGEVIFTKKDWTSSYSDITEYRLPAGFGFTIGIKL